MKLTIKDFVIDKNHLPASLIFHGVIYAILVLILALSILFVIPIQEKIGGDVVVLYNGFPIEIKTKQSGPVYLKVKDKEAIQKGDLLATQLWNVDQKTYQDLSSLAKSSYNLKTSRGLDSLEFAASRLRNADLPDIQGFVLGILAAIDQYRSELSAINPKGVIFNMQNEIKEQYASIPLIDSLSDKQEEKISLIRQRLQREKALFEARAISLENYTKTESVLLDEEAKLLSSGLLRQNSEQNIKELESDISSLENTYRSESAKLLSLVVQAVNVFREAYYKVAYSKFINSPIDGIINKSPEVIHGMEMSTNQTLFRVVPDNPEQKPEAYMYVALKRSGEIRSGQKVFVNLEEYNPRDYGVIEGIIQSISPIPDSDKYRLDLDFELPLQTSFGFVIDQRPTYNGFGEILTRRLSIYDKIIKELRWNREQLAREPAAMSR